MSIVQAVPESHSYHELESDWRETLMHKTEFFQILDERLFQGVFLKWISTVAFPLFLLFVFFSCFKVLIWCIEKISLKSFWDAQYELTVGSSMENL